MKEGGRVSLPAMRRGLSPEGRRIRERHSQGSLTIGVQGVTVHPRERTRSQSSFLQENVRRLREIQARCRESEGPARRHQPLKATRQDSASTSSSIMRGEALGDGSHVKTGLGAGRGDSAHSDYYSLSEEPPDPPSHSHRPPDSPTQPHHPKKATSSRFQNSVVLKPLTTSLSHPPSAVLTDPGLTKEMRRLRMDSLVSKITNQRPACEMDYQQHYRSIENQHRLLLDAADKNHSSSGEGGSGGESVRGGGGSLREARSPQKMVRAHSFDRGLMARGRREGSLERKTKPNELKSLRNYHHRPSSTSSSSSFSSPQPARRFSKSVQKCSRPASSDIHGKTEAQLMYDKGSTMSNFQSRGELVSPLTVLRAKSDLDRSNNSTKSPSSRPLSRPGSVWSEAKPYGLDVTSSNGDINLNSTYSSSCDLYTADQEDPELPHFGPQEEDLRLAIRPDSQSSSVAEAENHNSDPARNDWDSSYHDFEYPQVHYDGGTEGKDTASQDLNRDAVNDHLVSERMNQSIKGSQGVDSHGQERLGTTAEDADRPDTAEETVKGSLRMRNDTDETRECSPTATHTILPNAPTSKPLKKQQQQSREAPLRRSQSLKSITQPSGEVPSSYQFGRIPRYLRARKEEQRRQELLAQSVDPDCPPGHQPLPDHERRNTLHLLHKSQTEVLRELSCLPVAQDTLRVKNARRGLEDKLTQIEEGLRIFSQPKVYIMNDD